MSAEQDKPQSATDVLPANHQPVPRKFRPFSWLLKFVSKLVFSLLVLLAVYVTAGRLMMGMLGYQADAVAAQLSQALNMPVAIDALNGRWSWFSPVLEVQGLRFTAEQTAEPHTHSVARAELSLDPFRSILARKAIVTRITISGLDLAVQQNANGNWVKVTQRVPVRIAIEGKTARPLIAGLSADVTVDTQPGR